MGNGYDFSDDASVIAEQRDAARQAEEWNNLTEKAMAGELGGINTRVTACILQLSKMITENDYKKTNDMLGALLAKDLGADGWLFRFYDTNKDFFSDDAREKTKSNLVPEGKALFDSAYTFYKDVKYLLDAAWTIFNVIRMLPLEEGFRIVRIKDNFEAAGFDESIYQKVDADLAKISEFLNRSWDEMEKGQFRARSYVERNKERLTKKELEKEYRNERMAEYQAMVEKTGLLKSFWQQADGHYIVWSDWRAKMKVIDNYTLKVAQTAEIQGQLERTLEECKKAREGDLATAEKNCTTQSGQFLCAAFDELVKAMADFAEMCLEVYVNFKEGNSKAPYCFMKKLPSMSSAKPIYDFYPNTSDPWDSGTYYESIYTEAALALGAKARLYTYDHGSID